MTKRRRFSLSTTQIILLSFLAVIFIGSLLLSLPVSSATRVPVAYVDALFTATTATCVTGLVTVPTATAWSVFGQAVILGLIQIGGLGVITVLTAAMLLINRKIGLSGRLLIQDAFNLNTLSGIAAFVKKVLAGTLIVEAAGALLNLPVFVPEFGARGIWISVFHSISAFCNAGMDIIGETSLCGYADRPLLMITTALLIILGGLGYIVWWDGIRVIRTRREKGGRLFRSLTLHSKIVLLTTAILLLGGTALIFLFEARNPLTLGGQSLPRKIELAFFQSVTTRTAGFAGMPQENLTNASAFVSLLLMFIGGSPVGTAGGIKTVTLAVLTYVALSMIRGKNRTALFGRSISRQSVAKAVAVLATSFTVLFCSTVALAATTSAPALDVLFETVSANATVGLSRNLTATLPAIGKIILIFTMYFGRVGPISLALAFGNRKDRPNAVRDPVEEVSIG